MNSLKCMLKHQINRYRELLSKITMADKETPNGRLEAAISHGHARYRLVSQDPTSQKTLFHYFGREERDLVLLIAQTHYERRLKKLLEKRLGAMERLDRNYQDDEVQNLYEHCGKARKAVTIPLERTMEQWMSVPYKGLDYPNQERKIMTKRGETVRSKSEKIIADRLLAYGIPYKYECPLLLSSHQRLYPDFTFFNPHQQELIYWEHFGRMDDPNYTERAIEKIKCYEQADLFLGENLIVSFETAKSPLDESWLNLTIKHYLQPMMGYHELLASSEKSETI